MRKMKIVEASEKIRNAGELWKHLLCLLFVLAQTAQAAGPNQIFGVDRNLVRLDIQHPLLLEAPHDSRLPAIAPRMEREGQEIDARFMRRTQSTVWVHFTVENHERQTLPVILNHPFGVTTSFELHTVHAGHTEFLGSFGDAVADKAPQVWNRTPAIAMKLQPGRTDFYIKVASDNPQCVLFIVYSEAGFLAMHARDLAMLCTLIGVIVVMLTYNVFIYLSLRYDYYLYYVGFGAVFYLCYVILSGLPQSYFLNQNELPNLSIAAAGVFGCLSFFAICQFTNSFLKTAQFFPRFHRITHMAALSTFVLVPLLLIETLILQTTYMVKVVNVLGAAIGTWIYYLAIRVAVCRYPPAYYFLLAFTNLVIGNTYSNMVIEGIIPISDIFPYAALLGGTCEILLLSVSLGRRVKSEEDVSKRKIQDMARELTIINQDLDQKVEERTRFARSILNNISVGLLRIEANGLIAGDFSRSSLGIFAASDLKGQYIWDVLGYRPHTEQQSMMQSIFELVLGEDQMNFHFNEDHLPRFHHQDKHIIELNWSPFLNGQQVEAILLLARDVTYIRRLEKEHQERADEAHFIMVVARHGVRKIRQYLLDETLSIENVQADLSLLDEKKTDILRALHTIKGNSRTFGLNDISHLAHALEDEVVSLRENSIPAKIHELLDDVRHKIVTYNELVEKYFTAETQRLTAPLEALEEKLKVLQGSRQEEHQHLARDMQWIINSMKYEALEELQMPLQHQVRELALHLSKAEPHLTLQAPGILVNSSMLHRLRSILIHLLRNAVDHGLEKPAVRQALQKPPQGRIGIEFHQEDPWMIARVTDDGSGLNLNKIWQKAVQRGLSSARTLRIQDVAEMIFESGLSAKDEAGMISGRGIGLDAVRDLCQEIGGTIRIISTCDLLQEFKHDTAPIPVTFEIRLPLGQFLVAESWQKTA